MAELKRLGPRHLAWYHKLFRLEGWPWTEESSQLPATMPYGEPWPKISIVTPSYNQGQFIEKTIRSVLLQGYPKVEFIIIDGGSTDNTIEIINKYQTYPKYCVSEPDTGQSNAINKRLEHATGDLLAWLNSDDYYMPGAFHKIAQAAMLNSHQVGAYVGIRQVVDSAGKTT